MQTHHPDPATATRADLDPFFGVVQTKQLTHQQVAGLASGLAAAIHVENLVDPGSCTALADRLSGRSLVPYDPERYRIPAARMGPVINEFNDDGDLNPEYWTAAEAAESFWTGRDEEVRTACLNLLRTTWDGPVKVATIQSRPLFFGIIRESGAGTLIHWDEIVREFRADLLDDPPIIQLAFNLFLSMPSNGGRTFIWRHRWDPRDEAGRTGFGYAPDGVLDGCQRAEVQARPGDVVLFDPRNFHAVQPGGGGRRLAVAFFIGISSHGELVVWS